VGSGEVESIGLWVRCTAPPGRARCASR
jgi:hypothetical protein